MTNTHKACCSKLSIHIFVARYLFPIALLLHGTCSDEGDGLSATRNTATTLYSMDTQTTETHFQTHSSSFEAAYEGCDKRWGCFGMTTNLSRDCWKSKNCEVLATFVALPGG